MEITAFFFLVETKGMGSCEVCGPWGMIKVFHHQKAIFILTHDGKIWSSMAEMGQHSCGTEEGGPARTQLLGQSTRPGKSWCWKRSQCGRGCLRLIDFISRAVFGSQQKWEDVQRAPIHPTAHVHCLPHHRHPTPEWSISYNEWTHMDKPLSPKPIVYIRAFKVTVIIQISVYALNSDRALWHLCLFQANVRCIPGNPSHVQCVLLTCFHG